METQTTELVPATPQLAPIQTDRLFNAQPGKMVDSAREYADVLKDVIEKQNLYSDMGGGRKHVNIEGWTTMGTMLGFLPREVSVEEKEDGSFEATVELYNMHTGAIVGQASSLCGMDEKMWAGRPRYARRSMAVTRATGKAYRLGFGWVMALAGYQVTPHEEMPAPAPLEEYTATDDQAKRLEKAMLAAKVKKEFWIVAGDWMMGRVMNQRNAKRAVELALEAQSAKKS